MGLATLYYCVLALCLGAGSGTDPAIQVDGDFSDWPNGGIATADQRCIYFQIDLPGLVNLQKCSDSITVEHQLLDCHTDMLFSQYTGPNKL